MQQLQTPTPELVRRYIEKFDSSAAGDTDRALTQLLKAFPANVQLEHILLKASAINALYNTSIWDIFPVAENIRGLEIDVRLAKKDLELIKDVARVKVKSGKFWNFYSFATKYCSWHMPDACPIFDSFVARLLQTYQNAHGFNDGTRGNLRNLGHYPTFTGVIEKFRQHYGLREFGFKELDKFLWVYGKEYFAPPTLDNVATDQA
jgi:hypothetical protein